MPLVPLEKCHPCEPVFVENETGSDVTLSCEEPACECELIALDCLGEVE